MGLSLLKETLLNSYQNLVQRSWYTIKNNLQDLGFCGPNEETCVANKTLKHKTCLVPCTGLYADTYDDSLKENTQDFEKNFEKKVMKGTVDLISQKHFTNFPIVRLSYTEQQNVRQGNLLFQRGTFGIFQ